MASEEQVTLSQIMAEIKQLGERIGRVEKPHQKLHQQQTTFKEDYEDSKMNIQPIEKHQRRRQDADPPPDKVARNCWNIKLAVPTFAGRVDPEAYFEWEKCMERVFKQHHYSEAKKVAVATSTFTEHALSWWNRELAERKRLKLYVLDSWEDIKRQLRQRHVSRHYHRKLMDEFREIVQGNKTVEEYYEEFDSLYNKVGLHTPEENLMTHFLDGLQERVACKVERYTHYDLPDLLQHAIQVEQQMKRKKFTSGKTCTSEALLVSKSVDETKVTEVELQSKQPTLENLEGLLDPKSLTRDEEIIRTSCQSQERQNQCVVTHNGEHKPEEANLEEVVSYPEVGELMETRDVHISLVKSEASQDGNHSHTKCLVEAKISNLNMRDDFCANMLDFSLVNRSQLTELPTNNLCKTKEQEENSEPFRDANNKDEQVSRTKLFEEGGYDVAPESTKTNHALIMEPVTLHEEEKGPASLGCGPDPTQTFSPTEFSTSRRTPDDVSAQKNLKINLKNSEINLDEFSAHLESPSKKNQPIISSHKGDMNFTSQVFFRPPVSDIYPLIWMQRSNQEELSCKPSCYGILIQIRSLEKRNHTEPILYEGIIDFSNQTNSKLAGLDLPALFGDLRAYVKELGCKLNCFEISTHQGEYEAWNHINPNFNERVMIFTNKCDLHLPYFEGEQFGGYQAYVWRPGEFLHQREDHMIFLKCFLDPWIRRIQSNHGFILKISRYKIERSDGHQKKSNFFEFEE